MKIRLLSIGKMQNAQLKALVEEYADRLNHFCDFENVILKDGQEHEAGKRLAQEAKLIQTKMDAPSDTVILDERGEDMDSLQFCKWISEKENRATKRLTFIIGSSHGLAPEMKALIPKKLRLSRFTLTHEMAKLLLMEQIYRAYCIQKNIPYHH